MSPEEEEQYRARQRSRARVMALLLGAFVILMFAITIAKIKAGMAL
jgi:cytochrome c oxidase assembly protein Cox11